MPGHTPQHRIKIGWVGAGFVGQVAHLVNYLEIPNADIVALAELRPKLGREICRRYGIPRYYAHHTALLEDPDVEAVVAIVRRQHTAPIALDVLRSGRHLFTEKPMAPTVAQAERLAAAAAERNLCYAVGFMRRHDEGVQIARRVLTELRHTGELGRILFVRCYLSAGGDYCNISGCIDTDEPKPTHLIWPMAPEWLQPERHREYEHFVNVSCHDLNLIRFLFQQTPKVKYVEYRPRAASLVVLDFGDFSGVFEWGDVKQNRWEEGIEVQFERGRLRLQLPPAFLRNCPARVTVYRDHGRAPGEVTCATPDWTWSFRRQDEAFVRDVQSGRQPLASGQDSLEDMRLAEEIWRAIVEMGVPSPAFIA